MKNLQDSGLIKREGARRNGRWITKPEDGIDETR
jgi:hypothetical protein